jgi:hypothetical protein
MVRIKRNLSVAILILAIGGCTGRPEAFDLPRARALWPTMNVTSTGFVEPGKNSVHDFEGSDSGKKLKLTVYENTTPDQAARIMDLDTTRLKNLYRTDVLPYHGAVSQRVGCEEREKPRFESLAAEVRIAIHTNERLVPGSCDPTQFFYRASYRYLYCQRERRLYLLHVYVPKALAVTDEMAAEAEVLKCL